MKIIYLIKLVKIILFIIQILLNYIYYSICQKNFTSFICIQTSNVSNCSTCVPRLSMLVAGCRTCRPAKCPLKHKNILPYIPKFMLVVNPLPLDALLGHHLYHSSPIKMGRQKKKNLSSPKADSHMWLVVQCTDGNSLSKTPHFLG